MKIKKNLWHLIWIIGLYITLIAILILIVEYKVKWENKDLNTYLYFYNCSGSLCTTENKISDYYSKVKCNEKTCPYIREKNENLLILAIDQKEYVFDYLSDKIINDSYSKYTFTNNNLIVKNKENKYGVINLNNEVLVNPEYNKIIDYKNGYLAYAENGKVGVINKEKNIDLKPSYEDVTIINDDKYAYLEDGKYYIASYETELPINNSLYDYIYAIDSTILVFKDNKLDILNTDLRSNLLLKIDTFYNYQIEKERESLNLYQEGNLLHFTIYKEDNSIKYIYDLKNNKLFS